MAESKADIALSLHKLGQTLREAATQRQAVTARELSSVSAAIREQWHLERAASFTREPAAGEDKSREIEPPEPDHEG
jgi:hypothetical protein